MKRLITEKDICIQRMHKEIEKVKRQDLELKYPGDPDMMRMFTVNKRTVLENHKRALDKMVKNSVRIQREWEKIDPDYEEEGLEVLITMRKEIEDILEIIERKLIQIDEAEKWAREEKMLFRKDSFGSENKARRELARKVYNFLIDSTSTESQREAFDELVTLQQENIVGGRKSDDDFAVIVITKKLSPEIVRESERFSDDWTKRRQKVSRTMRFLEKVVKDEEEEERARLESKNSMNSVRPDYKFEEKRSGRQEMHNRRDRYFYNMNYDRREDQYHKEEFRNEPHERYQSEEIESDDYSMKSSEYYNELARRKYGRNDERTYDRKHYRQRRNIRERRRKQSSQSDESENERNVSHTTSRRTKIQ